MLWVGWINEINGANIVVITRSHTLTVTEEDEKKDSAGGIILFIIVEYKKKQKTKNIPKNI